MLWLVAQGYSIVNVKGLCALVVMVVTLVASLTTSCAPSTSSTVSVPPTSSAPPSVAPATWNQTGTDLVGREDRESLGYSVALLDDHGDELLTGGVGVLRFYRFSEDEDEWVLRQDLSADVGSSFCLAVVADGSAFVVGEPHHDDWRGRATVYRRRVDDDDDAAEPWDQRGEVSRGEHQNEQVGFRVAAAAATDGGGGGAVVVVSAWRGDRVRAYRYDDDDDDDDETPILVADVEGDAGSNFGSALALSADATRLFVGAHEADVDDRVDVGTVRAYSLSRRNEGGVVVVALLQTMDGERARDGLGWSVDASSAGNVLAAGTFGGDHVAVYVDDGARYVLLGGRVVRGPPRSYFGAALSLSADGDRLVVGAHYDDVDGIGENVGRAYVHALGGPRGHAIIGAFAGSATFDHSGRSTSISADGRRVAVGAPYGNGDDGESRGYVRVFEVVDDNEEDS